MCAETGSPQRVSAADGPWGCHELMTRDARAEATQHRARPTLQPPHVHFRFMLDELIEIRMRRRGLARTNHARETGEMSRDSQLMTQV